LSAHTKRKRERVHEKERKEKEKKRIFSMTIIYEIEKVESKKKGV